MTLAFLSARTTPPVFTSTAIQLPDRWYLDLLCRRQPTQKTPYLFGSQALSGLGVTVYVLASGICQSHLFGNRVRWLVGDEGVDHVGYGSGMALLLGGYRYGMASQCQIVSVNTYDADGVLQAELYEQAITAILADMKTLGGRSSIVLTCALREPKFGDLIVRRDLDRFTKRLLQAGAIVVSCAGDGLRDAMSDALISPALAEICSPNQLEDVFTIGAFDYHGHIPSFSNYGRAVCAFAPGVDIGTLDQNGKFILSSTTRNSAALVAGIFALYLEKFPFATILELQEFVKDHFLPYGNVDPYPLIQLQQDVFENDDQGTFSLRSDDGAPFSYLTNTKAEFLLAHAFFTKATIDVPSTSLGQVLANTQFEFEVKAKLKNLYHDDKPCHYTLLSVDPINSGEFFIGEESGILFGLVGDVSSPQTCSLEISISDGLHQYQRVFTLYIQPNYVDSFNVGGVLKGVLPNVSGLDITDDEQEGLLIQEEVPPLHVKQIPIKRDVLMFTATQHKFVGQVATNPSTGQFFKTLPFGSYNAIVVDTQQYYDAYPLDHLQAIP